MSAPPIRGPHDVPNLRVYLLDRWRQGGAYEKAARVTQAAWSLDADQPYGYQGAEESEWQRRTLADESMILWWVSAEMVDEITHVAGELPDDVTPMDIPGLTLQLPDGMTAGTKGLVILESPMRGIDARGGQTIDVNGFVYGATRLAPFRGHDWRYAVSIASYRYFDYDGFDEEDLETVQPILDHDHETWSKEPEPGWKKLQGTEWLPLGRSDWPLGEPVTKPIDDRLLEQQYRSMSEDRRWLAALHLVAADHRVASVQTVEPSDRKLRRPSERKNLKARVRVVYLRQLDREDKGERKDGDGEGRHRRPPRAHIVRSHPRWQACGPDMTERKLILVPRHTRGHGGVGDDGPSEGPPTVRAVTR